ncbi:uncharacterized protein LOC113328562 [Papaver somniferum]|uniref:uncharacterized protein LOC113328562 n=1 Tax=Papaver somniferum TaxID=3469 RepID=UPI000E701A57|nr:uncharacterized protein LOC113328562 [Papaver somniferum]
MFMWKLIKDILPVALKLQRRGISENSKCPQCQNSMETISHLFLQCPIAAAVWSWVSTDVLQEAMVYRDITQWIHSWIDKSSLVSISSRHHLMNLAVFTTWFIWKSRCLKLFEGKTQSPQSIVHQIIKFCSLHNICIHNRTNNISHHNNHMNTTITRWQPPPTDWIKINFDVSYTVDSNYAGFFIVLRNHVGELLDAVASTGYVRDIDQAEAMALLMVLKWIQSKGISRVQVEGDNKAVIEAVQRNQVNHIRWEDQHLISESIGLYNNLQVQVRYVNRVCNGDADVVDKYARKNKCSYQWEVISQAVITPLLSKDVINMQR